jgi:uncharacterized membrane protein
MSDPAKARPWYRRTSFGALIARIAEVALAGLGIAYFMGDSKRTSLAFLAWFDLVALAYLAIGFVVVRRTRGHLGGHLAKTRVPDPNWTIDLRRRLGFLLSVVASLTGLTAASDVLIHGVDNENDNAVRTLAVIAVICSWTLLHAGYAAFYRHHDGGPEGRGFRFPREEHPILLDYLYFSMTLGVSFAASDVEVITRRTRWHVMVHEIVSFFYNTAILGIAVSVITGTR